MKEFQNCWNLIEKNLFEKTILNGYEHFNFDRSLKDSMPKIDKNGFSANNN